MNKDIINHLNKIYSIADNMFNHDNDEVEEIKELIKQIFVIDTLENKPTSKKAKKINLYDYATCKQRIHYNSRIHDVIYCENGFKVATTAHILLKIKENYPIEYENKLIEKNGSFRDENFVNYKSVLDCMKNNTVEVPYNEAKIKEFKETYKTYSKVAKKMKSEYTPYIKVFDSFFSPELFFQVTDLCEVYNCSMLLTQDTHKKLGINNEEVQCLCMPINNPTEGQYAIENPTIYVYC